MDIQLFLEGKVEDFFSRQNLKGSVGILGVSGGPDSVALLRVLVRLQPLQHFRTLIVAHLNHQLRGPQSDADEKFVAQLTDLLRQSDKGNVVFEFRRVNVAHAAAETGNNLENFARQIRYHWFEELAEKHQATWVATGHTADDQAETVLFRLLRGTGIGGLAGIPMRRKLTAKIDVIRPFLDIRRNLVLQFLTEIGQPFCQDESNLDLQLTRNRLRQELLPHLEKNYNPAVVEILGRLARQAEEMEKWLRSQADCLLLTAELPPAGSLRILRRSLLQKENPLLQGELFRILWKRENWPEGDMDYQAWTRLVAMVDGPESVQDFPSGIQARTKGDILQIGKKKC